jgi:hypothetical protein
MNGSEEPRVKSTRRLRISRRTFIASTLATCGASMLAGCSSTPRQGKILSAFEDARGDQYIGGLNLADGSVFGARIPVRAHGCALRPDSPQRALFFARRPGTQAFELDLATKQARLVFKTRSGQHLSGHGVFSADGKLLFTPEHDYERVRGVLSVRDARDYRVLEEIDTRGIDPHELAWLPGGERLLVANGGIMTHPRSYRRKLNLDTMDPSLCVIDAATGACLEQWRLPEHRLSIRHLSVASDGSAAVGLQFEGPPERAPSVVALYRPQRGLELLDCPPAARAAMHGYVASVCLSERQDLIAASCPYGAGIACWSKRTGEFLGIVTASEAYGLSQGADGTIMASLRDGTAFEIDNTRLRSHFLEVFSAQPIHWDDHWVAAA